MESELSGIFRVKLVTKNIVRGSPRTQFMHMRVNRKVKLELEHLNINDVEVRKIMTHLLQPSDLTTNGVVKKIEQREFRDYFTNCITEVLPADPKRDVTAIKVDLKLSTLKPIQAETVSKVYEHLKSDKGKQVILNGFRVAAITETVKKIRENPKAGLKKYCFDY